MSQQLISLSPDLSHLREEGYEVSIEHGHLVVRNVPYVTSERRVERGILVSTLSVSGNQTNRPDTHVVMFIGSYPCDRHGRPIEAIRNMSKRRVIGGDLVIDHQFSSKPREGYPDYHAQMSTYATILSAEAGAIEPSATPRTHRIVEASDGSPFVYFDNASGRAGIADVTAKLAHRSIAIIGLGGTGSYVLDLVAKTPVDRIDLFDDDVFEQHTAFRAPGAPSMEELRARPRKVDHFTGIYARMHKGIVPHAVRIAADNADLLRDCDMAFVCVDDNAARAAIVRALEALDIPFIDVGMGLELVEGSLIGTLRTTTSTPGHRDHARARGRIPMKAAGDGGLYGTNIQVGDLNALNACLAVIRWKKLCGFYHDTEREHFSLFTVDGNHLLNEDAA